MFKSQLGQIARNYFKKLELLWKNYIQNCTFIDITQWELDKNNDYNKTYIWEEISYIYANHLKI